MTPLEKLTSIVPTQYISDDGDTYQITLKPGLTDQQIDKLAENLPAKRIPTDIRELLKFTRGFEFGALDEITFDRIHEFGLEEFFPNSVQLAGDGFGNFWILDIESNGNWGHVFYVCHDPPVIVKNSDNLVQFLEHIDEFGKNMDNSHINLVHEEMTFTIWKRKQGLSITRTGKRIRRYGFKKLRFISAR